MRWAWWRTSPTSRRTISTPHLARRLTGTAAECDDRADAAGPARALAEFSIEGLATVLPFHRHIVEHPAFVGSADENGVKSFGVYTKWIETEWENPIPPHPGFRSTNAGAEDTAVQTLTVEVDGRLVEVKVRGQLAVGGGPGPSGPAARRARPRRAGAVANAATGAAVGEGVVVAPMQGTVVKIAVEEGQQVAAGELVAVLEAMKMENPVTAPRAGTVSDIAVQVGASVSQGAPLLRLG